MILYILKNRQEKVFNHSFTKKLMTILKLNFERKLVMSQLVLDIFFSL